MRISSANIGMESARTYQSSTTRKLSVTSKAVTFSLGQSKQDMTGLGAYGFLTPEESDNSTNQTKAEDDNNDQALARLKSSQASNADRIRHIDQSNTMRSIDQVRQRFVLYLWEMFFGKDKAASMADEMGFSDMGSGQGSISYFQLDSVEEVSFEESEEINFAAAGTITTEDGRAINVHMDINMSRSFSAHYKEQSSSIYAMCDPLVLNFDGDVADLSDLKFRFDLDGDGNDDEISTLQSGSGFLALDKNGDGIINDGQELFGTQSGDGFADLAAYDEDHNGWIDENDSIYDKLRIWIKDNTGEDTLCTLKDKDVGAIYLGHADTDFTLRGEVGAVNGAIRKSGLFLYENGLAGSLVHLDMAN